MIRCTFVLFLVAAAQGMPALDSDKDPGLVSSVLGVVKECVDGDVSLCLKVCFRTISGITSNKCCDSAFTKFVFGCRRKR